MQLFPLNTFVKSESIIYFEDMYLHAYHYQKFLCSHLENSGEGCECFRWVAKAMLCWDKETIAYYIDWMFETVVASNNFQVVPGWKILSQATHWVSNKIWKSICITYEKEKDLVH